MSLAVPGGGAVAITGPLGFVASRLVPRLEERGVRVIGVVRPGREADLRRTFRRAEPRAADLADPATLAGAFAGARAVVHLAGLSLVPGMLPAMLAEGVRAGVFVGSAGVHTRLKSAGADAKRAGEAALRASPLSFTILRPSMIYGSPRDRNIIRLLRWIERWPVVPAPLGGRTPQQPVHVDDLVAMILAALERTAPGGAEYDVGGPEPIPLRDLVHECARALRRPVAVVPVPLAPAHALAVLARRLGTPFPVSPEQVLRLAESKAVDIAPAQRDLGYSPRAFREGVEAEVAMMRGRRPPPAG